MTAVGVKFNTFLSNLELTSAQVEDARTKYNGVCNYLHDNYYSSSYNGSTKLLVGSYGKNTAISPPTDIDVLFLLPPTEYERYNSYSRNGQSQLLQDVKNKLLARYSTTSMRADGQVVMVNFSSYFVEIVPAFLAQTGAYIIPNTTNGGTWKITDPNAEMSSLTSSNKRSNGNTIKLIKMVKAWKHYCNVPIKSLIIELSAIDFLSRWQYFDKTSVYHDYMIRDYLKELVTKKNAYTIIPGTSEAISYGDSWESRAKTALNYAEDACRLEAEKKEDAASVEWKKIFGDRFYY